LNIFFIGVEVVDDDVDEADVVDGAVESDNDDDDVDDDDNDDDDDD